MITRYGQLTGLKITLWSTKRAVFGIQICIIIYLGQYEIMEKE